MARQDSEQVVGVYGVGMVSALGLDASTSCAAARAGIVRSQQIDYFATADDDGFTANVVVHAAPMVSAGFRGEARLMRLAKLGLADLARNTPSSLMNGVTAGLYIALPDPNRIYELLELIDDEETRASLTEDKKSLEEPASFSQVIPQRIVAEFPNGASCSVAVALRRTFVAGHTGLIDVLAAASEDLKSGTVSTAIVGVADSLLDEETLAWLNETARLKSAKVAKGLQPGEAAVFLLLRRCGDHSVRHIPPCCVIDSVCFAEEEHPVASRRLPNGAAVEQVVARAAGSRGSGPLWILTDQNGEDYRAIEWGRAQVRLAARSASLSTPVLWYPAASFGDTAAASGGTSIALAIHAFARHCAPSDYAVITSCDDGTRRAALAIRRGCSL